MQKKSCASQNKPKTYQFHKNTLVVFQYFTESKFLYLLPSCDKVAIIIHHCSSAQRQGHPIEPSSSSPGPTPRVVVVICSTWLVPVGILDQNVEESERGEDNYYYSMWYQYPATNGGMQNGSSVEIYLCSAFIQCSFLLWASLVLSGQLGILAPRVTSPNCLCDSILGLSESPLLARRSQGASTLEFNSFAFQGLCHLFQIWILRLAQHWPISTFQGNPTKEKGRDGNILFSFFCPIEITHPCTNRTQCCLTSVISQELAMTLTHQLEYSTIHKNAYKFLHV